MRITILASLLALSTLGVASAAPIAPLPAQSVGNTNLTATGNVAQHPAKHRKQAYRSRHQGQPTGGGGGM